MGACFSSFIDFFKTPDRFIHGFIRVRLENEQAIPETLNSLCALNGTKGGVLPRKGINITFVDNTQEGGIALCGLQLHSEGNGTLGE